MEKVTIKTCVRKDTQKGTFFTIELSDGRKGISSNDLTSSIGNEIEVDVKEGKEYQGEMQYYFNLPKQDGQASKFPKKDWNFEKKKSALENAVNFSVINKIPATSEQVIQVADYFFKYLNS